MRTCFIFIVIATVFLTINLYLNYATNNQIISQKVFGYSLNVKIFLNYFSFLLSILFKSISHFTGNSDRPVSKTSKFERKRFTQSSI